MGGHTNSLSFRMLTFILCVACVASTTPAYSAPTHVDADNATDGSNAIANLLLSVFAERTSQYSESNAKITTEDLFVDLLLLGGAIFFASDRTGTREPTVAEYRQAWIEEQNTQAHLEGLGVMVTLGDDVVRIHNPNTEENKRGLLSRIIQREDDQPSASYLTPVCTFEPNDGEHSLGGQQPRLLHIRPHHIVVGRTNHVAFTIKASVGPDCFTEQTYSAQIVWDTNKQASLSDFYIEGNVFAENLGLNQELYAEVKRGFGEVVAAGLVFVSVEEQAAGLY